MVGFTAVVLMLVVSGLWLLPARAGAVAEIARKLSQAFASRDECGQVARVGTGVRSFDLPTCRSAGAPLDGVSAHERPMVQSTGNAAGLPKLFRKIQITAGTVAGGPLCIQGRS